MIAIERAGRQAVQIGTIDGLPNRRFVGCGVASSYTSSITMAAFKVPDFAERATAAREARQRALDQLRDKAPPDAETVARRQAARAAREIAAAEKRAARAAAASSAKAAKEEARIAAKAAAEAAKPYSPSVPTAAEMKAARDARYAARKARGNR